VDARDCGHKEGKKDPQVRAHSEKLASNQLPKEHKT